MRASVTASSDARPRPSDGGPLLDGIFVRSVASHASVTVVTLEGQEGPTLAVYTGPFVGATLVSHRRRSNATGRRRDYVVVDGQPCDARVVRAPCSTGDRHRRWQSRTSTHSTLTVRPHCAPAPTSGGSRPSNSWTTRTPSRSIRGTCSGKSETDAARAASRWRGARRAAHRTGETARSSRTQYDRLVELGLLDDDRVELLHGTLVEKSLEQSAALESHSGVDHDPGAGSSRPRGRPRSAFLYAADESETEPDLRRGHGRILNEIHPDCAYLVIEVAVSRASTRTATSRCPLRGIRIHRVLARNVPERIEVYRPGIRRYRNVTRHAVPDVLSPGGISRKCSTATRRPRGVNATGNFREAPSFKPEQEPPFWRRPLRVESFRLFRPQRVRAKTGSHCARILSPPWFPRISSTGFRCSRK